MVIDIELTTDNNIMYTIKDIQSIFHIGKNKAYELVKLKGFPSIHIGRTPLIPKAGLEKWVNENTGTHINL